MKSYGVMRFAAGFLKLIGWLVVILGALVVIVGLNSNVTLPYLDKNGVLAVTILASAIVAVAGIFIVGAGEMISAVADIAANTAYLRPIAINTEKTVGFFEHISNKSNSEAPAPQAPDPQVSAPQGSAPQAPVPEVQVPQAPASQAPVSQVQAPKASAPQAQASKAPAPKAPVPQVLPPTR